MAASVVPPAEKRAQVDPAELRNVMSPMVDQSELPFRLLCRRYGAGLCYTPMLSSHLFVAHEQYRKTFFSTLPEDRPLAAQFCGNDPQTLLAAARLVEKHCDFIDLNLGCPQQMAKRGRYGAFMMEDWPRIKSIVSLLSSSLSIPVSCKIRIFRSVRKTVSYARALESAGCSLLAVHGRLREQKGAGLADWHAIAAVREAVRIPVIANGNILSGDDAEHCLATTGGAGVMVAETLLHDPTVFAATSEAEESAGPGSNSGQTASGPGSSSMAGGQTRQRWTVWAIAKEYLDICDDTCSIVLSVKAEAAAAEEAEGGVGQEARADEAGAEGGEAASCKKPPLPISWVRAHLVRIFHGVLTYDERRLPQGFALRLGSPDLDMPGCRQLVLEVEQAYAEDYALYLSEGRGGRSEPGATNASAADAASAPAPVAEPAPLPLYVCQCRLRKGQARLDPLTGSSEMAALVLQENKLLKAEERQRNSDLKAEQLAKVAASAAQDPAEDGGGRGDGGGGGGGELHGAGPGQANKRKREDDAPPAAIEDAYRRLAKLGQEERYRLRVDMSTVQRRQTKVKAAGAVAEEHTAGQHSK